MKAPIRLLLIEISPDEPERQFRTSAYPFLLALARSLGWQASWCVIGVRYEPSLLYELDANDLRLLLDETAKRKPTLIVINEQLSEDQRAAIEAAGGGSPLVYCPIHDRLDELAHFIKRNIPMARVPQFDDPRLIDRLQPLFHSRVLNGARAPWAGRPLIRIPAGPRCAYRSSLARNRFYRRLTLPTPFVGCAFCGAQNPKDKEPPWDPIILAVKLAVAAMQRRSPSGGERRFDLIGHALWQRLDELITALVQNGVKGAELSFMPRIDELLRARPLIERCLPLLAENRLALRVWSLGVENFSPAENLRLNKGITAEQVHEAASFITAMTARWPDQFRFPPKGLSMILFTPWTSLEDLRINLDGIARCPLLDGPVILGQRLQIFPGLPIARLAEADGLLIKKTKRPFYNAGCITSFGQEELPWRFRHPEVGALWRLGSALSARYRAAPSDEREPMSVFRRTLETIARRPL